MITSPSSPVEPSAWAAAARLVRRTGFGATGAEIDAVAAMGTGRYLAMILAADPQKDSGALPTPLPTFAAVDKVAKSAGLEARKARNKQLRGQVQYLTGWWVRRMVAVEQPFGEKLTFTWHNHFATSATKVRNAPALLAQNQKLRTMGRGDFRQLALAMLTDAAMLDWLDGQKNTVGAPNENLSREFMELFALGHGDGYTEQDVREGARALTGWRINPDGSTALRPKLHDDGTKTMLGVAGNLDDVGYCDAILARPASAAFLATRMYGQLVSDHAPTLAVVKAMVAGYGTARSLTGLLSTMLGSADFTAAAGTKVVAPVEWLIGAVRALQVPVPDQAAASKLLTVLRGLGQIPFAPPNVSGWPTGAAWLSTAAADLRMTTAAGLAKKANLDSVSSAAVANRLEATAHLLGVPSWTPRSVAVLKTAASNPVQLVTIALNTPEYLTH
ncbi:uncharacterized protein (DUF1800 family) [Nakamurella sp. UYEF19]|uniref:DUF1800 domain-containing protein n=1 Tax=Nakamurella sp. UYEF19 TaxID=1756392 RepID=UPI003398F8C0